MAAKKKSWREKLADDKGLRAEGHRLVTKGKRTLVADHETKAFTKLR